MKTTALLRLKNEYKSISEDPPAGISAFPVAEDNLFLWNASIIGPDESPWEGGVYNLVFKFQDTYPETAPNIRFTSHMFHPNSIFILHTLVFTDGSICLDILQKKWSPAYTIGSVLCSIQSLLTDPNPDSPANSEAANLFLKDPKQYRKLVRLCAEKSVS